MEIFYKYTKNFGANFFLSPTVKISNPKFLNDPFESEVGDNFIHYISERMNSTQEDFLELKNFFNGVLKVNGIFSVSETSRNPLMWSHYGDEHKGLCIGFKKGLFKDAIRPNQSVHRVAEYTPQKVKYDNYRFDRNFVAKSKSSLSDFIKEHLLTKSDYWIYEKEYRCIIPFSCSTSFIIDKNSDHLHSIKAPDISIDDLISIWTEDGSIKKNERSEYVFSHGESYVNTNVLSTFGCVSFLYNVDPIHIYSIHAGVRVSDSKIKELYHVIKENEKLSHIKLFRFKLSNKRFEILPEIVDSKYIEEIS